jgi:hypothetical protein
MLRQRSSCLLRSPNGKQDADDQTDTENDSRDPGSFDDERPSWVKWHVRSSAAVERQR